MAYFYPTYEDLERERASEDIIDTIDVLYAINEKQKARLEREYSGDLKEIRIKGVE